MVLTKSELLAALQNEVRILLHLAGKIDRTKLDYRPTPKQRSTIELLKYLSVMGPTFLRSTLAGARHSGLDRRRAGRRRRAISIRRSRRSPRTRDTYAALLADVSDADLRAEIDGWTATRFLAAPHRQPRALRRAPPTARSCSSISRPAAARNWAR